ncbi:MAG: peptidylprolyl isomerase [Butyrivibrio sp.]|nr:peptidylprolyl isomerase [Butyrivibrio sp.]
MIKKCATALAVACSCVLLSGCGENAAQIKVVFTTGFSDKEVFRIEDTVCTLKEAKAYLVNTQEGYEESFGSDIWGHAAGSGTVQDRLKDSVLAKIAQIKAMDILAAENGITLDEKDLKKTEEAADEYYASLTEADIKAMDGITKEEIAAIYRDHALADKLYDYIIRDINPEISDDEARTITVKQILIKTYSLDAGGNRVEFDDSKMAAAKAKADSVYVQLSEGADFDKLIADYNEAEESVISFGKGGVEPAYEEVAFNLGNDEVSKVVKTDDGYVIIKCISTFNREETEANKVKIVEERKREVFGEKYDHFVATMNKQLNERLWNSVTLVDDPNVTTKSLMEVYQKHIK